MINLEQFIQPQKVIVPIYNNHFQYNRKKYIFNTEDGWYNVIIQGNDVIETSKIFSLEITPVLLSGRIIYGYVFNSFFIFANMDFARRSELSYMVPLRLYHGAETFSSIVAVLYEDNNVYYLQPNYLDYKIYDVRYAFERNENIQNMKAITPELKIVYLLHAIEIQKIVEELEKAKKQKEYEELLKTIAGRLYNAFTNVGATVNSYTEKNNTIEIIWQLNGSSVLYNTIIDKETFRVREAGFCMSGDDKSHSISSLVLTARDYEENNLTYITRR